MGTCPPPQKNTPSANFGQKQAATSVQIHSQTRARASQAKSKRCILCKMSAKGVLISRDGSMRPWSAPNLRVYTPRVVTTGYTWLAASNDCAEHCMNDASKWPLKSVLQVEKLASLSLYCQPSKYRCFHD